MDSPYQSQSSSSRASWMYSDPYAYQYSDVIPEQDFPSSPYPDEYAAGSTSIPYELEGSSPLDTRRYELSANPRVDAVRDNESPISEPSSLCGLSRSSLSTIHKSVRYQNRHDPSRRASVRGQATPASQPDSSGIIPVLENAPAGTYVPESLPHCGPRPSPPGYSDGLIPVDENATTPKEPNSDFDAILRNIGPISKSGKGNKGRERSSRYYDRYTSNFG